MALFALVAGGIVVALAIGEVVARYTWRHPLPPRLPVVRGPAVPAAPVSYRTNSAGFRGPEYPETKPAGVYRLVLVGDSVALGVGVREEETYAALVEATFNDSGGVPRLEVLNLGQAGLNLGQILYRLENIGLRYEPDLIIYGFTINDIEGPAYRSTLNLAALGAQRARLGRFDGSPSFLIRVAWRAWASLPDRFAQPSGYLYDLEENYLRNPRAWGDFVAHLERLAAIGTATNACVHVLIHTHLQDLTERHILLPYYDRVGEAALERGLSVTQSLPYFVGQSEADLHVGPSDPHPSPAGHRLLARALLDGLRALPPRCRVPRTPAELPAAAGAPPG